jgi:hypothetical protein
MRRQIPQLSVISISCRAKTTGFQLCSWRDGEEAKATPQKGRTGNLHGAPFQIRCLPVYRNILLPKSTTSNIGLKDHPPAPAYDGSVSV